ncbi:hypothetical protein SAMN04490357_0405 [Streptomyces misionensis]|uniref:Uncharacterized protein n=1 Tax=Streptomyces misionensis TaxID=67331 RepID=A0A1H4M8J8_9ACTN|nr:hypothetical protein SAMN04490357_0405 [Streptomyces misionensis]
MAGPRAGRSTYMTRMQLTDKEGEFVGPYLPIGRYGP